MPSLSKLASGDAGEGALPFPFPFPTVVGRLVIFTLDPATSSLIVIPLALLRGGISLPATFGLTISAKTLKELDTS